MDRNLNLLVLYYYVKKNKVYFFSIFMISLFISSMYELSIVKKNESKQKYISYTTVSLGNFIYLNNDSNDNVVSLIVNRHKLKGLIKENVNKNFNLEFNLLDVKNSTVLIKFIDEEKEVLKKAIDITNQIIYNHAVNELNSKKNQEIKIKGISLPSIIDNKIVKLEYRFNIYFVLSFILLVFMCAFILKIYSDKGNNRNV